MTGQKDKKREAPISYRPPAQLRDAFKECVRESGLSTNHYITKCIFEGGPPRVRGSAVDRQMLARLLAECALIRDGLARVEKLAGEGEDVSRALDGASAHLEEIAATVMKAAGRKP